MSVPFSSPIDASTRYCAVFGHPIKHSASPAMQNAGIAALRLNWRYLAFDVDPQHLREAIAGAKRMGFVGVNLTVPHKLLALDMMDALDVSAKLWGAVNTVRFEPDAAGLICARGFNTDADAIVRAIKEEFEWPEAGLRGASVLLLGAGGAASTTALRLAQEGIDSLYLANRTMDNARQLAEKLVGKFPDFGILKASDEKAVVESPRGKIHIVNNYSFGPTDLVINATSLGLRPDDQLPEEFLHWLKTRHPKRVYDMIYRPAETPLLQAAKAAGCHTANGLGMLLYQGAKALEIWTDPLPRIELVEVIEAMRHALEKNVYGKTV